MDGGRLPHGLQESRQGTALALGDRFDRSDALGGAHPLHDAHLAVHVPQAHRAVVPLGEVRQSGGKRLTAWAAEGDFDAAGAVSNTFSLEWPPRSGRVQEFPEIDRAAWTPLDEARVKLVKGQVPLLDRLLGLSTAQRSGEDSSH